MFKVIRNDDDYNVALETIEALVAKDPPRGSEEADRLEVLAVLLEEYEQTNWHETLPSPVEAIRFRMEQAGLKQRDLVPYFGSASRVSEVLSGKRNLTLQMIRALTEGLGIPARVLIQEEPSEETIEEAPWAKFPVKEMVRRNWISNVALQSPETMVAALKAFFAPLDPSMDLAVLYRMTRHVRTTRKADEPSLIAWTAKVLLSAGEQNLEASFKPGSVTPELMTELVKISWADNAPALAREFLGRHGIALVVEPHFPGTHLDGAAILSDPDRPIVGLTLRYDRLDNFWFVLMHELAHISLHGRGEADVFFDDLDGDAVEDMEDEADQLAGEVLVPSTEFIKSPASRLRTAGAAENLARKLGIHSAIVAGKMRHFFNSYRILTKLVGQGEVRRCFPEVTWP